MKPTWTYKENLFVRENWRRLTDAQLAKRLGRSEIGVQKHRTEILRLLRPHGGAQNKVGKFKIKPAFRLKWREGRGYLAIVSANGRDTKEIQYARWWWEGNVGPLTQATHVLYRDGNLRNINPSNFYTAPKSAMTAKIHSKRTSYAKRSRVKVAEVLKAWPGKYFDPKEMNCWLIPLEPHNERLS